MNVQLEALGTQYGEHGFAVLPNAFTADALAELRQAAADIVEAFDVDRYRTVFSTRDRDRGRDDYFMKSAEQVHCFLEEHALDENGRMTVDKKVAINKIGHALHDRDERFQHFARQDILAQVLRAIGIEKARLWQTMYIFKQPRIGGEVRWHQDASYLRTTPAGVVGFWVALEDADRSNGCLWVQPGGHRSPLREVFEVEPGHSDGRLTTLDETPWPESGQARAVEVEAGSLVIFSDHMPHYSSENRSEQSRQAFTMHFADVNAQWSEKNWLQRPTLPPFLV